MGVYSCSKCLPMNEQLQKEVFCLKVTASNTREVTCTNLYKLTCTCQTLLPLLKENREYFLAPKALTQAAKTQACRGVWGYP